MSDCGVYGMGKSCGRLVVAHDAAKVSAGQHFASAFIIMQEIAPIHFGQVMERSWVNYGPTTDRLSGGRDDFFLPALHTLLAVSVCLNICDVLLIIK